VKHTAQTTAVAGLYSGPKTSTTSAIEASGMPAMEVSAAAIPAAAYRMKRGRRLRGSEVSVCADSKRLDGEAHLVARSDNFDFHEIVGDLPEQVADRPERVLRPLEPPRVN
jgi:hypothetical protein